MCAAALAGVLLLASACGSPGSAGGPGTPTGQSTETTAPQTSTSTAGTSTEATSTAGTPTGTTSTETTSTAAPTTGSSSSTEHTGGLTTTSYVYYVVDVRGGLRLARELRDIPAGSDGPAAAVAAMISGAQDPDYTTTWNPATRVLGVDVSPKLITVNLSAAARTANVGSPGAAMMIQQLVWTVTEAARQPNTPVQLDIDGKPAGELWGAVSWEAPIAREEPTAIRALVQIDFPREGAETRSPVTISGDAAAFEANVPWRILNAAGAVVASGHTMTSEGMTFAPYSFQVRLAPGKYTVEVSEDDPSGGAAGPPTTDTRRFTVTG